jgi:threonine synthase
VCHPGIYAKPPSLLPTIAPAIDIQVPYNLERLFFFIGNQSGEQCRKWMTEFEKHGRVEVPKDLIRKACPNILAGKCVQLEVKEAIFRCFESHRYVMDPHTAVGLVVAEKILKRKLMGLLPDRPLDTPVACLATAHPAKFGETIKEVLGFERDLPASIAAIEAPGVKTFHRDVSAAESEQLESLLRYNISACNLAKSSKL